MIYKSKELEKQAALQVAQLMAAAARTAPKGKGTDRLEIIVLDGTDKEALSQEMRCIGEASGAAFFQRDAGNVDDSLVVLLIGTRNSVAGVPACGFCGFEDCAANAREKGICAFATGDLGIAVGSAAAVAADHRCDNRIMFSAGKAALNLGYFSEDVIIAYGIPLAIKGKSPFFDRG